MKNSSYSEMMKEDSKSISIAYSKYITGVFCMTSAPAFIIHYGDYKPGGIIFLIAGVVAIFVINIDREIRKRLSNNSFKFLHVMALLNNIIGMYFYLEKELYPIAAITFIMIFIFWFRCLKGNRKFDW